MRLSIIALATVLAGCAQQPLGTAPPDPAAMLLQSANRMQAELQQEDEARQRAKAQEKAQEQRYAAMPPSDLMAELKRYCPRLNPPCDYAPPETLLNEAMRRGLIQSAGVPLPRPRAGTDCVALGDELGGGIINCQ